MINKKFYNKSSIKKFKKYKTINYYFIKAKSNLEENIEKKEIINKNCTLNGNYTLNNKYKLTKQNTAPYINHISEGNSINNNTPVYMLTISMKFLKNDFIFIFLDIFFNSLSFVISIISS